MIGIIHRDIKPSNIFLNGPNLVIGDLGHAKYYENSVSRLHSNSRFGTKPYNSPESIDPINNDPDHPKKTDIW